MLSFHHDANHSQIIPQDTYEGKGNRELKRYVKRVGKVLKLGQQNYKPFDDVNRIPTVLIQLRQPERVNWLSRRDKARRLG